MGLSLGRRDRQACAFARGACANRRVPVWRDKLLDAVAAPAAYLLAAGDPLREALAESFNRGSN